VKEILGKGGDVISIQIAVVGQLIVSEQRHSLGSLRLIDKIVSYPLQLGDQPRTNIDGSNLDQDVIAGLDANTFHLLAWHGDDEAVAALSNGRDHDDGVYFLYAMYH